MIIDNYQILIRSEMFMYREDITPSQKYLLKGVEKILNSKRIDIEKGQYNKQQWSDIFKLLTIVKAHELSFYSNQAEIKLYPFMQPKYSNLRCLYLSCNKIVSVEALGLIDAPQLKEINLYSNQISKIKSLRKMYCPRLEELNIGKNPIKEPEYLTELHFPNASNLFIQAWPNLPCIGQTKRWIAKMQPQTFPQLKLKSNTRKKQTVIDSMLRVRYPKMKSS